MFAAAVTILVVAGCGDGRGTAPITADATVRPTPTEAVPTATSVPSVATSEAPPPATPTLEPIPTIEPSADDVLALAGTNGVPGLVHCGANFAFDIAALDRSTGAEDRIGPEYDALRLFLRSEAALLGQDPGPDPKVREVARYDGRVAFLIDRVDPGPWGEDGGPFLYVYFNQAGETWRWAGSGDCQPRAWGPAGYVGARWTLDPAFTDPRPTSRVLHILVSEHPCSHGSASGRIGPAYVVPDRYEIHIEIVVKTSPDDACRVAPATSATIELPDAIGERALRDTNEHLRFGTGG